MKPTQTFAALLACTVMSSACLTAQDNAHRHHPRYKLIDLGTLGGPISYGPVNGDGGRLLNNDGIVTSYSDTTAPDPDAPGFCYVDCLVAHAFRWSHGVMTDLGAVDDRYGSAAGSINDLSWSTGQSETGVIDPALNFPLLHTVLWKGRKMVDIGTLPDGTTSIGISVNNTGQVVGFGNNGVPDPFAGFFFPSTTQIRTFLWEHGQLEDIGTLGGPDTVPGPGCNNQRLGVIVGKSFTNFTPNASSGVPTQDPFLWDNGTMIDLGNLGGTASEAQCINNRGEVIGKSTLPGDLVTHAFLWRNGRMQDLGTLGGDNSQAIWINDAGEIVGSADLPTPGLHDAVVWKHGRIHDLGTVPGDGCSRGTAINARGQVVGGSSDCANYLHAFVWEDGGPMRDLNTLIAPGLGVQLTHAININDRGEILAKSFPAGTTPNDDEDLGHLVLLVPCGDDDREDGCAEHGRTDDPATAIGSAPAIIRRPSNVQHFHSWTTRDLANSWQSRLPRQFWLPLFAEE
jgi:probable HAF family extracellular repeat protein